MTAITNVQKLLGLVILGLCCMSVSTRWNLFKVSKKYIMNYSWNITINSVKTAGGSM